MKVSAVSIGLMVISSICAAQAVSHDSIGGPDATVVSPRERSQHEFGVGVQNAYTVTANAMAPLSSDMTYSYYGPGLSRFRTGGSTYWLHGQVSLPTGALITELELDGCDTNAADAVNVYVHKCPPNGGDCSTIGSVSSGGPETPGCGYFFNTMSETVNQLAYSYDIEVYLGAVDSTTRVQSVRLYWQRQLSPAPATATFSDVPTSHPFFRVIEALNAAGVTSGCGGGNFCPDGVVTRKEVAKFLARALGLAYSDYTVF
jgi:hypothetical protein